ncbi:MAG: GIY-YIG nuclease family protein [Deltaproteobacteria bacterium]|nr:GIY-YIG nuclease family protein [Deltaproteobacteria bacterium]
MAEPFTIRIFVPHGDPDGVKIVDRMNWTGIGVAFPRAAWPDVRARAEFGRAGVYILVGAAENEDADLPMVYVGQGEVVRDRIESHFATKDFWEWGYAFVSSNGGLNRGHVTWLEHSLLTHAQAAKRCHLDNVVQPREPALTEAEKADTHGFLREVLRTLPLLGVRVFEKPKALVVSGAAVQPTGSASASPEAGGEKDTLVVPAQADGFQEVFIGQQQWYAIRIGGGMLPRIKYVAAYQTNPISAITHYAAVEHIEPYGDEGKYKLVFQGPALPIGPIPFGDAAPGSMQGPRYTSLAKLRAAKKMIDIF